MANFDAKETLKRIQERRAKHRKRQAEKTISGVSPEVIEAVRNLDKLKSTQKNQGEAFLGSEKNFITMLKEHKKKYGCTGGEAYRAIAKMHPDALERCIREANS
jgi:hypothetical protein